MSFNHDMLRHKKEFFKPILWVEGPIGVGKTTFVKLIAETLNYRPFYEPVDQNPYLAMFYQDMERWAFSMQMHLLSKRYAMQQQAAYETLVSSKWNGCIMDRGLPGDRVFAENLYEADYIHELEYQTYLEHYELMTRTLTPPSLLIYLDAEPIVCFERAKGRARQQESHIEDAEFYNYLVSLKNSYEIMVKQVEKGRHVWSTGIKVLRLDWNSHLPFSNDRQAINNFMNPVINYVVEALK